MIIFRILMATLAFIFILSTGGAESAEAAEYKIIVNESNPTGSIRADTLRRLMLKKVTRWEHGESAKPIDQSQRSSARERFTREVLRKSISAVKAYWQTQVFSGRGVPPAELMSDRAVIDFVARNPGAIGYISAASGTKGVKVVDIID